MLDELDIIRAMLAVNGEGYTGGPTLETTHPSVQQALEHLRRTLSDFQARGWWFNRERCVKLLPDLEGKITIPAETSSFSITAHKQYCNDTYENERYVNHGTKVYDNLDHTYIINKALYADLILTRPVSDLPGLAANYLKHRCAQEYYEDDDGDLNKASKLQERTQRAWHELYQEELKVTKKNALSSPAAQVIRYRQHQYGTGTNPNFIGGGR